MPTEVRGGLWVLGGLGEKDEVYSDAWKSEDLRVWRRERSLWPYCFVSAEHLRTVLILRLYICVCCDCAIAFAFLSKVVRAASQRVRRGCRAAASAGPTSGVLTVRYTVL